MALDGDEVDDDDDRDMFCIPPTLWVNADYHYHGHAGEVFPELARTSIATDLFVLF